MKIKLKLFKSFGCTVMICFIALLFIVPSAYSQQMPNMKKDSSSVRNHDMKKMYEPMSDMEEEVAHPIFTHMGIPEAVGMYSLRLSTHLTQIDGNSTGDFGFHLETGLSKFIGLHVRNDRFLTNDHTEIMFQFAAIRSKNGMSGFSPIIEFEVPTHKGVRSIETLVGFSTTLSNSHIAFNQVFHYSPREDMVEGSAALVYKVSKRMFLITEIQGEKMPNEQAIMNFLFGVKVRINNNLLLALGFQVPVTTNKDFTSQYIFQPDFEWKK